MITVFKSGIVALKSYPKAECHRFYVREKNVFSGLFKREKQICITAMGLGSYTLQEFIDCFGDSYYMEGDTIYYYPHCTIYLADGTRHDKFFETQEDLKTFLHEMLTENPHINI